MRRFANLYLILFGLDAGLSLLDEFLQALLPPAPGVSLLRALVALLVILLSLVVYTLLGLDNRLPKRIFIPLTLYACWCAVGMWPLLGLWPLRSFEAGMAFGQVFIAGVALIGLKHLYGAPLLPAALFAQRGFSWRNTLVFGGINLALLPFVVAFTLVSWTANQAYRSTGGFMRLSPVGIYMTERDYTRAGQRVRLDAMMHIARSDYYGDLAAALPTAQAVILAEGVTDRDRLLRYRFSYDTAADLLGLSSQQTMNLDGNLVDLDHPDAARRDASKADIVRADVDLNSFDPLTVEFLNVIGRTLFGDEPLPVAMEDYNAWVREHAKDGLAETLRADILERRNTVVIDAFRRSLAQYQTVVIPWGAMHMPAIEQAVLKQGFVAGERRERLSLDFRSIPYGELWAKWLQGVQKLQQRQAGERPDARQR